MRPVNPSGRRYPIGVVTRKTGLKADLVRVWERRHRAIEPARSETGRRLYSDEDVRRLVLLRDANRLGHPISQLASLSDEELETLGSRWSPPGPAAEPPAMADAGPPLERCIAAIRALDAPALGRELELAALEHGLLGFVEQLLSPLMTRVGELWRHGSLGHAHEHLATAAVRTMLGTRALTAARDAPRIVAATPQGQHHELGLVLVAAVATAEGWRVIYLGADLPASSIAEATLSSGSVAVAISATFRDANPDPADEVRALARELPGVPLLIGGQAARAVVGAVESPGLTLVADLRAFRKILATLDPAR